MANRTHSMALLFALAALVVLTSVVGISPIGSDDVESEVASEKLVDEMITENPPSFEGQVNEVIKQDDSVVDRTTYDVVDRPSGPEQRVRITTDDGNVTTLVTNGTTAWLYDKSSQEVITFEPEDDGGFIVPALEYDHYDDLVDQLNVTYAGTERVAGQKAHTLVFTGEGEKTASIDVAVGDVEYKLAEAVLDEPYVLSEHRLWIDHEHAHPLKERTTLQNSNETITYTKQYDQIDFDAETDENDFELDPPDEAEQQDPPEWESERFDSVAEANRMSSYRLQELRLPEEYELGYVRVSWTDDRETTTFAYSEGADEFRFTIHDDVDYDVTGMDVEINDVTGTLTDRHGQRGLYWNCGDLHYSLVGELSAEELVLVAEQIECT